MPSNPILAKPEAIPVARQNLIVTSFLAGGAAGAISRLVTSPIDIISNKAKVDQSSLRDITIRTWQRFGVKGFFRGCGISSVVSVPSKALDLVFFEMLKRSLAGEHQEPTDLQRVSAGALGGALSTVFLYPAGFVLGRIQVDENGISAANHMRYVFRQNGLRGFFNGMSPILLGAFPFCAITYGSYDIMKRRLAKRLGNRELTSAESSGLGATSGCMAAICVYPLSVVAKRLNVQGMEGFTSPWGKPYSCMVDAFRRIVQEEGVSTLFRGCAATAFKRAIGSAASFTLYERVVAWMSTCDVFPSEECKLV